MSYSSTPNRNVTNDDYFHQRLGNISFENDYQQEHAYVRNENIRIGDSYDSQDHLSGNWDYGAPTTKNLDAIVTELTPEEVRWFYKSDGEKRWLEFSGYDSLRIEIKYRELYEQHKYSQFSAFSDLGSSSSHFGSASSGSHFGASTIRFPSKQPPTGASQYQTAGSYGRYGEQPATQHKIVVRGGLYDINLDTWKCASIYWPGEECLITRGTWFYEGSWQPLDREQSRVLEAKHMTMFQGHKLSEYAAQEGKGTALHTETFPEFVVEWFSPGQVYLYSENKPSKIVRSVTTRLGFHKSTGYRLFRGYKSEASLGDRPDVEITHLVFVIHGIGQKMDTGRIIRNTSSFRDCVSWLKQKYFSNYPNHRAEFFPVEWRSNLQLDGELVDAITPNTLHSLRQMLNASAMDIMYYTSPLYGGEVQRGLREELNRLYSMFSARNPYFINKGGKISVIAHSLGCVILYDIIMGLKPGSMVQNTQQGLLFQIQNFFCLGSPLSVFLALRWKDSQIPGKMESILPQRLCRRLYNVFHPTDPVAYRVEPLLVKEYFKIAPLIIQPYNATYHTPYSEMPVEMLVPEQGQPSGPSGPSSGPPSGSFSSTREDYSPGGTPRSPTRDRSWSIWGLMKGPRKAADGSPLESLHEGLECRLDYILRESNLGVSYLSALTSHTAYWTNYDIAYFILTQTFPELEKSAALGPADKSSYLTDPPRFSQYDDSPHSSQLYPSTAPTARPQTPFQPPSSFPQTYQQNQQPPLFTSQQQTFSNQSNFQSSQQPYQSHGGIQQNFLPQTGPQQTFQSQTGPQQTFQSQQQYNTQSGPQQTFATSQSGPQQTFAPSQSGPQHTFPPSQSGPHQTFQSQTGPQQPFSQGTGPQNTFPTHSGPQHNYPPHSGPPTNFLPGSQPNFQSQSSSQNFAGPPQNFQGSQQNFSQPNQSNYPGPHQNYQDNYSQGISGNFPGSGSYQGSDAQNYQQMPQAATAQQGFPTQQIISGLTKNLQTKTGFFDKMTDDKKQQGASSPTKSTKSFFPSFNLSSLTSPVKNLSNSLSNISNQMTNMAANKDLQAPNNGGGMGGSNQNRTGSFLGGGPQNKHPSPNQNPSRNTAQIQFNQAYAPAQFQQNPFLGQNPQLRSSSPYDKVAQYNIRSSSPVNIQNRVSSMQQYGPIETPVGAIKPKTIRIQPKVPSYDQNPNMSNKGRCVSPLGQARVVCSGSNSRTLPASTAGGGGGGGGYNNLGLGSRSLSSGNLRNSTLVSGVSVVPGTGSSYPGNRSNLFANPPGYMSNSGLNRRTMSRPNLSSSSNAGLGVSTLVYNSPTNYTGSKTFINREYSGPSSR